MTGRTLGQRAGFVLFWAILCSACATANEQEADRRAISDTLSSSVQVFADRSTGGRRAGSAVVIAGSLDRSSWLVITAAHTFEPVIEQTVRVVVPTREGGTAEANILAIDSERDLALLEAEISDVSAAQVAHDAYLVDPVWVVAFPWGRDRTVVKGAVSQIHDNRDKGGHNDIRGAVKLIDASVSYGMSGGGVYDSRSGELLGLVRGYRTAHLSLDSSKEPLKIPVAGETTVVSSAEVVCFLHEIDAGRLDRSDYALPEPLDAKRCTSM